MRWGKRKKENMVGQIRYKTEFLIFPKNIDDEWRWLEKVTYKQRFTRYYIYYGVTLTGYEYKWKNIEWIN